ncbi:MAG: protein kinase, partial [Anaerolineales bacterium]
MYRASQPSVQRDVAVKIILPEHADQPEFIERFQTEAYLVARLEHPHIVPLHDYWSDGDGAFLVMRWLNGGSLRDCLRNGPPKLVSVAEQLEQITDALAFAHENDVIHRDLKPENIMLDERGNAYLADFGIAKDLSDPGRTKSGMILGSFAYLSPEQARSEKITPRTDIYALGVVLYELLTCKHPFPNTTPIQAVEKHLNEPIPSLKLYRSDLPSSIDAVIQKATEKNPAKRFQDAQAMFDAFLEASSSQEMFWPTARTMTSHDQATLNGVDRIRHNLPKQLTPFIGRSDELVALDKLLANPSARLITILGPGGMGKTRLALEVATSVLSSAHSNGFSDGVYFVPLASLQSVDGIVPAVAEALGLRFSKEGEIHQQLIDHLRQKSMLLLLDNFDHLVEGGIIAAKLATEAPLTKLLVTSRSRLNVQGEHVFTVAGMDVPFDRDEKAPERFDQTAEEYDSMRLFMSSAELVQPGFELEDRDLELISEICRLVEGVP